MILTLTANPSLDRTIELGGPVLRGQVQRAVWAGQQPGGKGVNVSRAVAGAGRADPSRAARRRRRPGAHRPRRDRTGSSTPIPTGTPLRSNITVTEPDGTTTKINEPGTRAEPAARRPRCSTSWPTRPPARAGSSWPGRCRRESMMTSTPAPSNASVQLDAAAADRRRHLRCSTGCGPDGLTGSHQTERRRTRRTPQCRRPPAGCGSPQRRRTPGRRSTRTATEARPNRSRPPNFARPLKRMTAAPSKPQTCSRSPTAWSPHRSSQPAPHRLCSTAAGARPRSILATLGAGGAVLAQPDDRVACPASADGGREHRGRRRFHPGRVPARTDRRS
jgi:1-phosphofructokinase